MTPEDNTNNCTGNTFTISVTVMPEPVMDPALATANVCSDDIINVVFANNGTSVVPTDYDVVLISQDAGLIGVPTVGAGLASTAIQNDVFTNTSGVQKLVVYEVTPNNGACSGDPFQISVTVDPEPVVNTGLDTNECSDVAIAVTLSTNGTSVAAANYRLVDVTVPVMANFSANFGNTTTGTTGLTDLIENDSYHNSTGVDVVVVYEIVPISVGPLSCEGDSEFINVTINPEPVFDPTINPAPVCSNIISGITLGVAGGSIAADHYDIASVSIDPSLTVVQVTTGANLANTAIFNDQFINTTSGPLSVTYKVTPVSAVGCSGDEVDLVLTVNPAPAIADGLDDIVCSDAPIGLSLTIDGSSVAATDYRIESMTNVSATPNLTENPANNVLSTDVFPLAITVADVNILAGEVFTNTSNNPVDVVYEVTPINGACESATPKTITITIEPEFTMDIPANHTICSGESTIINLNTPGTPTQGDVQYSITADNIDGFVTGFSPTLTGLGESSTISEILVNSSNSPKTVEYTISYQAPLAAGGAPGCTGTTNPVIAVTVDPVPVMDNIFLGTVCSGELLSNNLTSPTLFAAPGDLVEFQLQTPVSYGSVSGDYNSPGGFLVANGAAFTDNLVNTTGTPVVVSYTFIPRNSNQTTCDGNSVVLTVTVNPELSGYTIDSQPDKCAESVYLATFNFPVGQAPFSFDYEIRDSNTNALIDTRNGFGGNPSIAVINGTNSVNGFDFTEDLRVVLIHVEDFNGCEMTGSLADQVISIVDPDPSFTIDDAEICNTVSEASFTITNYNPAYIYTWNWGDGSPEEIATSATTPHSYDNPTFSNFTYTAFLTVKVDLENDLLNSSDDCIRFANKPITIYPDVLPIIFALQDKVCSGDEINMINASIGAEIHSWYYEVVGFGDFHDQDQSTEEASFNFVNNDPSYANPQEFIIHYQGSKDNGGGDVCSTDLSDADTQYSVMVYKEFDVDFNTTDGGRLYSLTRGSVTVDFVNSSTPVNDSDFSYDWNYGNGRVSDVYTPESQLYTVARDYDITHTVTNTVAINDGVQCSNSETITITVDEDPIVPDFEIDITEGCVPTVFTITNNTTGAANQFTWKVSDGATIAFETVHVTSQDGSIDPDILQFSFEIFTPGIYTVELIAQNVQSGQSESKIEIDLINVYDAPIARFEKRPNVVVYVPDDELTVFNFTDVGDGDVNTDEHGRSRQTEWLWDFGDGSGNTADTRDATYTYERVSEDEPDGVFWISLTASYNYGSITCSNTVTDSIRAELGGNIKTPNAFTPNISGPSGGAITGDNSNNDIFLPQLDGVVEFQMQIYDRWGVLVFESTDRNIGWDGYHKDGKIMPQGVYVYKLVLRLVNGEREVRIGDITLLK